MHCQFILVCVLVPPLALVGSTSTNPVDRRDCSTGQCEATAQGLLQRAKMEKVNVTQTQAGGDAKLIMEQVSAGVSEIKSVEEHAEMDAGLDVAMWNKGGKGRGSKPTPAPPPAPRPRPPPPTPPSTPTPTPPSPTPAPPTPPAPSTWDPRTMKMTHYWDCSGQACDAPTLQPWNTAKYVSPPGYGPQDPNDFGGALYGEKMWLTGAASDTLSKLLGADDTRCGKSDQGGCGKCLQIQVPDAVQSSWTAVVMKKNRCPPHTNGCAANTPHFDIAAPGFDNLQYSTANICGQQGTGFANKGQSEALGSWYNSCSDTAECAHLCDKLEPEFRTGCKLFASWGWKKGDPSGVKFRPVACPAAFVQHVSGLFDQNGVVNTGDDSSRRRSGGTGSGGTGSGGTGGGCCRFGADCGNCGDGSGWCHKSASNCAVCTGTRFDATAQTPSCGR